LAPGIGDVLRRRAVEALLPQREVALLELVIGDLQKGPERRIRNHGRVPPSAAVGHRNARKLGRANFCVKQNELSAASFRLTDCRLSTVDCRLPRYPGWWRRARASR